MVLAYGWTNLRIRCLEPPTVHAQQQELQERGLPPPLSPRQTPPTKAPPFSGPGDIQWRWDYSDLVCTGTAEAPVRTGVVESLGGSDRDQLASWVTLETCFKGAFSGRTIRVLGDSVFSPGKDAMGYVYAGPPTGFLVKGRNLLFLRATQDIDIWRVTVPVYAICIPLADTTPPYSSSRSADSIRHALVAEFESAIDQGQVGFADRLHLSAPDDVARQYLPYIWQVLGREQGMQEFKQLMAHSPESIRREVAMAMLREGNQEGEAETLALLEDKTAVSWKRENAALALANATSAQARQALERVANEPGSDELRHAAQESLSRMNR
jgi:hypothetical protein